MANQIDYLKLAKNVVRYRIDSELGWLGSESRSIGGQTSLGTQKLSGGEFSQKPS